MPRQDFFSWDGKATRFFRIVHLLRSTAVCSAFYRGLQRWTCVGNNCFWEINFMCGIVGILEQAERKPIIQRELCQMLGAIRHRGPDEFGLYLDPHVGLGSARLSIIDLS